MTNVVAFDREDFRHSDGELPHGSSNVWAIAIFRGSKAHFFERYESSGLADGFYSSICDGVYASLTLRNGQNTLLGAGTYPKCKRCMSKLRKQSVEAAG